MKFPRSVLKKFVVYVVAAGCLAWVFRGVSFDDLLRQMRSLNPWWILAALALDVISTISHGFRWQLLLWASSHVSVLRTTQAIYAGLFASQILPLRAGEFVRGYLVSRFAHLPFASVLPSMITERVFDGSVLVLGLGACAFFVDLPQRIENAGLIVGSMILVVICGLALLAFINRRYPPRNATDADGKRKWYDRAMAFVSRFARELRVVWTSPQFLPALAVTLLLLSLQVLSFWLLMRAYGLHVSVWVPAVTLIVIRLGTAIPSAPANIGPYQFFCVLSLTLFGIEKTTATGFAIVVSIALAIPLVTLGPLAFVASGLSVSELRKRDRGTVRP
jgi:hypothetical protein